MFPSSAAGFETLMTHLTGLGIQSHPERAGAGVGTISEAASEASCAEMLPAPLVFITSCPLSRQNPPKISTLRSFWVE